MLRKLLIISSLTLVSLNYGMEQLSDSDDSVEIQGDGACTLPQEYQNLEKYLHEMSPQELKALLREMHRLHCQDDRTPEQRDYDVSELEAIENTHGKRK